MEKIGDEYVRYGVDGQELGRYARLSDLIRATFATPLRQGEITHQDEENSVAK